MRTKVNQHKEKQATRVNMPDDSSKLSALMPANLQQQKQVDSIESSSLLTLQQKKLDAMFGTLQRDEELEEESKIQKKSVVQREVEEEEGESELEDKNITGSFQAKISNDDAEELTQQKAIQRDSEMEEDEEKPVEMKASPAQKQENNTGMPDSVKSKMESSFNTDFSNVKVHPNSSKAPEVGALAYTQGHDVHFAPGQFMPESGAGQQLLGHELAHVVQQREGRVKPTTEIAGMPVNDNPSLENEADTLGAKASR